VTLKASDNVGVAQTYYTTDGSEPSAANGAIYAGAFVLPQTATVRFRSADAAGNLEPTGSRLLQVDAEAPTAKITSPASATDNLSIVSVRFYLDGASLGSKTVPTVAGGSTYQWKWDSTSASKGAHTLTALATDVAGNLATSTAVPVTVAQP
jgi:hypothetical protein